MSTHKHFDKICYVVLAFTLIVTLLFMNAKSLGVQETETTMGYEDKLFDTSKVHTINIVMDDWDEFLENCTSEEYYTCNLVIDDEEYQDVAIRGKGNTSLTQVASYGNSRYSFKVEFDHYDDATTYYGLDKLSLNNIIQDNTYMKDYLTYQLMNQMGVASSLCSYVYITVNGEDWGLYLAIEGVEESFLERNYGKDYGELYKPDSSEMGGEQKQDAQGGGPGGNFNNNKGSNGSDDVLLKYIDDDADSYSNIFDNAKTDITKADKARLIESLKKLSSGEDLEDTVDVDAVIRYFVVHNFVLNFDSYTGSMIHNYYLYEEDGQLQMIPWDYNLAFGGFQSSGDATSLVNYPIDTPVSGDNVEDRPMLAWIFENEEYTELYHEYFAEFISQYFDSGDFEEMIDSVSEMISPYVEKDPTKFCTYDEFETGVSTLKEFCQLRAKSISGQLDGTIGSTSNTQESDTLIDAGDLQISDMGTMNNNSNAPGGNGGANIPNSNDEVQNQNQDQAQSPEQGKAPDQGQAPGAMQEQGSGQKSSLASWLMLGASVLILTFGLIFAFAFRRKKS